MVVLLVLLVSIQYVPRCSVLAGFFFYQKGEIQVLMVTVGCSI